MKIPRQAQMWGGGISSLYFLLGAIITAAHAKATFDWIRAYSDICAASLLAGVAWNGYQRRPKTGPSREI